MVLRRVEEVGIVGYVAGLALRNVREGSFDPVTNKLFQVKVELDNMATFLGKSCFKFSIALYRGKS